MEVTGEMEVDVLHRDHLRVTPARCTTLHAEHRAEASGKGLRRCIFILLTGGPSHFETFDPKPGAPLEIRGPLKSIATATTGLQFCETLPLLAQRSETFSLLRTLSHDATPIHETGQQLCIWGLTVRTQKSVGSTREAVRRA